MTAGWLVLAIVAAHLASISAASWLRRIRGAAPYVASPETESSHVTRWGLYQTYWHPSQFESQLDEQLEWLGVSPDYILFFRGLGYGRGFPWEAAQICRTRGATPIVSLELRFYGPPQPRHMSGRPLDWVRRGDFDDFFRRWAQDAREFGGPVIFRFAFEMNGDWFPWGRQPEAFKEAWVRIRSIFREQGASEVRWLFSPNVLYGDMTASDITAYYPGDAWVDLVGLDGYNFGDDYDRWHRWQSFQEVFGRSVDVLSTLGKPVLLSEVGCADDDRKAEWMTDFLEQVGRDPRILGFIYFNYDKRREREPNWALHSDHHTQLRFMTWVRQSNPTGSRTAGSGG
jgi:hypothetical protein